MRVPSHADAFQVLLLQAADEGRGPALFGESLQRARDAVPPFLVGEEFPEIYLEHPLAGEPFLDVTILLHQLEPGMRVESPAAGEHATMLDWYADARRENGDICCGFELDTDEVTLPPAAVHFQPRSHMELVRPFCEAAGDRERADLYLDLAARMPDSWPLSFFGMFRGRAASPLRVCGYLGHAEKDACAQDPDHLAEVFDAIGFTAYDDAMLSQVSTLMADSPGPVDFQLDVYPDGSIGDTFAVDLQFETDQPEVVRSVFEDGAGTLVMKRLESWGIADERWKLAIESTFARALPVELDDGGTGRFAFVLMPKWLKVRWADTMLRPAKLYHLAKAHLADDIDDGAGT